MVVQSPLLYYVMDRNGEANFSSGPTVRSPPNRLDCGGIRIYLFVSFLTI